MLGSRKTPLRDFYHALLRLGWWPTTAVLTLTHLGVNTMFAGLYLLSGGIEHARPGSFLDAFFFSVQSMGTIGYGAMYPASTAAHVVVVLESIVSLGLMG